MEASHPKDIIVYQANHQAQAQQFAKRLSVDEFKKLDEKRIKDEFNVLRSWLRSSETPTLQTKTMFFTTMKKAKTDTAISTHVLVSAM